ncbi:hypothetical protein [Halobacillus mangrovi]|uniref:hypothetical protein n=1 Tax=Halobacillus mangrovi TaxID=402384 RepID=UPI003D952A48
MGLRLYDIGQLNIYEPPQPQYDSRYVSFNVYLPGFSIDMTVVYHKDYRTPKDPNKPQKWKIGIVQNVLFEHMLFEYHDQQPIFKTWARPILDLGNNDYRPFYNGPGEVTIKKRHRDTRRNYTEESKFMLPIHQVNYGPKGFEASEPPTELIHPWSSEGDSFRSELIDPFETDPIRDLILVDQPSHTVRFLMNGKKLKWHLRLMVFRFWVIAMGPNTSRKILGFSEPFTLFTNIKYHETFTRTLRMPHSLTHFSKLIPGNHAKRIYTEGDFTRWWGEINQKIQKGNINGGQVWSTNRFKEINRNKKIPEPVITDNTAIQRGHCWMKDQGLYTKKKLESFNEIDFFRNLDC